VSSVGRASKGEEEEVILVCRSEVGSLSRAECIDNRAS